MGKYTDIKSNFVKEKLRKANWEKDRVYIDVLIFLEKTITKKVSGYISNIKLHCLLSDFKKEYVEIFKELDPQGFKKYLLQENKEYEREIKELEKLEEEWREIKNSRKKDWEKAKKKLVGKK